VLMIIWVSSSMGFVKISPMRADSLGDGFSNQRGEKTIEKKHFIRFSGKAMSKSPHFRCHFFFKTKL
jgi:hypothetical protein